MVLAKLMRLGRGEKVEVAVLGGGEQASLGWKRGIWVWMEEVNV